MVVVVVVVVIVIVIVIVIVVVVVIVLVCAVGAAHRAVVDLSVATWAMADGAAGCRHDERECDGERCNSDHDAR
jgi:hypothetical protein